MLPPSGGSRPLSPLPRGLQLVHPRVRFRWERYVHVASRAVGVRVTLCGRVSVGEPADPSGLRSTQDPVTGSLTWSYVSPDPETVTRLPAAGSLTLCSRCAARL